MTSTLLQTVIVDEVPRSSGRTGEILVCPLGEVDARGYHHSPSHLNSARNLEHTAPVAHVIGLVTESDVNIAIAALVDLDDVLVTSALALGLMRKPFWVTTMCPMSQTRPDCIGGEALVLFFIFKGTKTARKNDLPVGSCDFSMGTSFQGMIAPGTGWTRRPYGKRRSNMTPR